MSNWKNRIQLSQMVRAYHIIFSTYGFWLPNDPRGSGSDEVHAKHLQQFGPATKVQTRQSVAHQTHDYVIRRAAKEQLKYPLVIFNGLQARAVARGFAQVSSESDYPIYACAILPEHVHLVLGRHALAAERIISHLKRGATLRLFTEEIHPLINFKDARGKVPSPWSKGSGWKVYLEDDHAISNRIKYVNDNPIKDGKPPQNWGFVRPFEP
ncbi:MAG: hypothetical protein IH984_09380 [Planctomycetes bacterium]|nr:hypothetical protein [Planctomycetota bacterium]